ncbi:ATP-binding cassette domain-containing protein [Salisaeta longa]|uniref:ATP-binding cassette domain-containing protein n=1 Tax=Salisaeta longa TaxID=503170 RepID=UPI0003B56E87|nr:ATP-binding cassette domain-containing protein [Salisaeta longa]
MIALTNIAKTFGATTAVDGLTLNVPAGETTVLIGPSGCGKSTVLRLITGLVRPDEGSITFGGAPLPYDDLAAVRHRMGYVIQSGGLFPHLTARANVTLLARHLGWSATRCAERLDTLTELVQLAPRQLQQYPRELSGGQRQRVSLMRALMLAPDVLLLDEPLGALDPMIRADLQEDLRAIIRQLSATVVLVTHDLPEAAFFGDTIVLMRAGRVVQQGPMHTLTEAPANAFVSDFVQAQRTAHAL